MLISPFINLDTDDAEIDEVIIKMKETSKNPGLKKTCRTDPLIKEFCRGLLHKLGHDSEQRRKDKDNIRTKLRAVGRLLLSLNHKRQEDMDLWSYIAPKHFKMIVKVVKEMGQKTPNLALTLGHYIKQLCQLKHSLALQNENSAGKEEADNFDVLIGAHWNDNVSAAALRRLKLRTLNKTIELPTKDDMVKLKEFSDSEISDFVGTPKPSLEQWTEACQTLMVRILLFNKRRVAEVQELKVEDILHAHDTKDNADIMSQLDVTEQALANRMRVVEVRGKSTRGLRKVFIILSEPMMKACVHLNQTRLYAGIDPSNEFLFARQGGSVLDGCKAMRDMTSKCPGLECPHLIRTRLLRKYLATTIQLLDMTGDELKMVADHMGHSVTVHTDVYRLQTSVLEKTKVARALIALENGNLGKFAGRNLASSTFEELPLPVVEDIEDNNTFDAGDSGSESDVPNEESVPIETSRVSKRVLINENDDETGISSQRNQTIKRRRWNAQEPHS